MALDAWRSFFDRLPTHDGALASNRDTPGAVEVREQLLSIVAEALPDLSAELANRKRIDPERFFDDDHPRWPGGWSDPPRPWALATDEAERRRQVVGALGALTPWDGAAVVLRDVEEMTADRAAVVLGISMDDFRQLLADGRIGVWRWLDERFGKGEVA